MRSYDNIIQQLKEQNIEFNILQYGYDNDKNSLVAEVVKKWKRKFIANKKVPHLDDFLWHIFSFDAVEYIKGEAATKTYLNQWKTDILIFNQPQQYLIECINSIPKIEIIDFRDDIYIVHVNMKWTYVLPHEISTLGPFFSNGVLDSKTSG